MTQSKYRKTHQRLTEARSWRDGMTIQEQDIVLEALAIAERLEGEPSEGMIEATFKQAKFMLGDRRVHPGDNVSSPIFKAMVKQLLKEVRG